MCCLVIALVVVIVIVAAEGDEKHRGDSDGFRRIGTGWCLADGSGIQRHLPAMWKPRKDMINPNQELETLCKAIPSCIAYDYDNNENGHLRFSSATALNAVNEPGWGKWSDGCKEGCVVKTAGDGGQGKCHVKRDVIQARYYLQGPDAEPHAFVTFDGKIATYVDPSVTSGALLPNGDIQWSHEAAKWCFRKDGGKPCKEWYSGAFSRTECEAGKFYPGARRWRIRAINGPPSGWGWDVLSVEFLDTRGVVVYGKRPIHSGSASDDDKGGTPGYEAERALLPDLGGQWGGRFDKDGEAWIGWEYEEDVAIYGVRLKQDASSGDHRATRVAVEMQQVHEFCI